MYEIICESITDRNGKTILQGAKVSADRLINIDEHKQAGHIKEVVQEQKKGSKKDDN